MTRFFFPISCEEGFNYNRIRFTANEKKIQRRSDLLIRVYVNAAKEMLRFLTICMKIFILTLLKFIM